MTLTFERDGDKVKVKVRGYLVHKLLSGHIIQTEWSVDVLKSLTQPHIGT